jgi:hypothetical protein
VRLEVHVQPLAPGCTSPIGGDLYQPGADSVPPKPLGDHRVEYELWLSMMPASTKARDLDRDPRILLHSIVTGPSPQAEIMVRGTVRAETAQDVHRRYAAAVEAHLGWRPVPGEFTLFAVDINGVTYIGHDAETNAQHVARWPAGEEYLRPSLTPTSLGPPQPVMQLLTAAQPDTSSP